MSVARCAAGEHAAGMRAARKAALAGLVLAMAGCGQLRDIGEEMGWIQPPPTPALTTEAAPSLEALWLPAEQSVADIGQAQWTTRWWQWVARFPDRNQAPYLDPDGRHCALYQDAGPVWFLAGTNGNFDVVRTCAVPADRHLFVPLINWIVSSAGPGTTAPCAAKKAEAAKRADHVLSGLVLLNGRPIGQFKRMRVASGGCFSAFRNNPPAATDGYWLMLKPLPPGKHQLAIAAAYREGPKQVLQNFRYELEVVEASAGAASGQVTAAPGRRLP